MRQLSYYLRRARDIPFRRLPKVILNELAGLALGKMRKYKALISSKWLSNSGFLRSLSRDFTSVDEFLRVFRDRREPFFFFSSGDRQDLVKLARSKFSGWVERSVREADGIHSHVFDLLGSGNVDLDAFVEKNGGRREAGYLPWHFDFKSGYRWPPEVYHKEIRGRCVEGADLKVPWELSRFQHLTILGQAYWFTTDEKYAEEFVNQVSDWIKSNPPGFGVNWACTMDVAIRVVNWIWGYYFFQDSPYCDNSFLLSFLKSILAHGQHILRNLENRGGVTSNHYLANLAGMVYLGVLFPEFSKARKWREFGVRELIKEMGKQVYKDGVDFEASTGYHRLVLEFFLSAALLCRLNGICLPQEFWDRLERMFDFVLYYIKPNGRAPQIGDNDSGRFHKFKEREVLDHSYLLSYGATLFENSKYKLEAFDFDLGNLWLFGIEGYERYQRLPHRSAPLNSKAFEVGGIYILRDTHNYMIVNSSPNGLGSTGGHAHNDKLSFELNVNGEDIIVDPGSYLYTPDPKWRRKFQSTAYHNTVVVDGEEQNRFKAYTLFGLHDDAQALCEKWQADAMEGHFVGSHKGYKRLSERIIHRREVKYSKEKSRWHFVDCFYSPKDLSMLHIFEWNFILAPAVRAEISYGSRVILRKDDAASLILEVTSAAIQAKMIKGWYSPEYGVKIRTEVLRFVIEAELPLEVHWQLSSEKDS